MSKETLCEYCGEEPAEARSIPEDPCCFGCRIRSVSSGVRTGGEGKNWNEGKFIDKLPPGHPNRIVTSEKEARRVCKENGINYATGEFESKADQDKAWDPKKTKKMFKNRVSVTPGKKFGQKIEKKGK